MPNGHYVNSFILGLLKKVRNETYKLQNCLPVWYSINNSANSVFYSSLFVKSSANVLSAKNVPMWLIYCAFSFE